MSQSELDQLRAENEALRGRVAELEARSVESRKRATLIGAVEELAVGFVVCSDGYEIMYANRAARDLLALERATGGNLESIELEFLREDGTRWPPSSHALSAPTSAEPAPTSTVLGIRHEEGVRWVVCGTYRWQDPTEQTRWLLTLLEITEVHESHLEQRRVESRALRTQKLEAIGKLAGGVAHDMNNILAVISGMAFVLHTKSEPGSESHQALDAIQRSCRRGRDLIRNLLGFARRGAREHRAVQLDAVLHEVVDLLGRTLPESVVLESDVPPLPIVMGDATELSTSLMNLGINAADAIEEIGGRGRIRLAARSEVSGDREWVVISVEDDGCGIPESIRDKVYEPFFTTKAFGSGTGLGLSMVHGTVQDHGGELAIEAPERGGTRVVIRLPRAAPGVTEVSRSSWGALPRIHRRNEDARFVVLVVEDHPDVLETTGRLVEALGYQADLAATGAEAIERFRAAPQRYGAVLLDLRLPDLDADELFTAITACRPGTPVVLTTGYDADEMIEPLLERGALGIVPKPMSIDLLRSMLSDVGAR